MALETVKKRVKSVVNISDVNKIQHDIMVFVDIWVHLKKTPVPHREIIREMESQDVALSTTIKAIRSLLKKSYLRKAVTMFDRTRSYVQLRRV